MTFSDILMQLLAFFIMRLAIAPYRLGAILPANKAQVGGKGGAEESEKQLQHLEYLKFHRGTFANTIEAEMETQFLPEAPENMSFALKEELVTLASTFGGGDFVFSIHESSCKPSSTISAASSFFIEELLATGVPMECLQIGGNKNSEAFCDKSKRKNNSQVNIEDSANENPKRLTISISQRRCDPLS